ncbi:glyoxalase [Streptococcus pseudopneumoniae]|uniref:glyoxalase n=1 Tax=Streptococcus pseudopneumoniae TaxID=257758 RepID=UPI00066E2A2B|nr:glyoxalase [Streptococcus pseudopneumoniae]
MFSKNTGIMLYVDDVAVERDFWSAIGFEITNQSEIMGFETFEMKPNIDSTLTFTVYAKEFIRQVSPEVVEMKPSLLFESADLHALHMRVAAVTDTTSPINTQPFPNFNFANPSGHYFAVRGI